MNPNYTLAITAQLVALRVYTHVYQFFPFLLFTVFAVAYHNLFISKEFYYLQYLGFSKTKFMLNIFFIIGQFYIIDLSVLKPMQFFCQHMQELVRFQIDDGQTGQFAFSETAFWFKDNYKDKVRFVTAKRFERHQKKFEDFRLFEVTPDFRFAQFVASPKTSIHNHYFNAEKADKITDINMPKYHEKEEKTLIPTHLNAFDYQTDHYPLFHLKKKISTLEKLGFSAAKYEILTHQIWYMPFFLTALAWIAYLVASRFLSTIHFFVVLLFLSITFFFLSEISTSFLLAEKISVVPTFIFILLCISCIGFLLQFKRCS